MAFKKRRKNSRFRGSHTHGRGFKKKARGSGHQGGKGMAGTGKRGDAKKTMILNLYGNDYFGSSKALRRGQARVKMPVIALSDITSRIDLLVKSGVAKQAKDAYDVDYSGYKILGNEKISLKLNIKASAASAGAIESVENAGGKIIFSESEGEEEQKEEKEEKEQKEQKKETKKPAKAK